MAGSVNKEPVYFQRIANSNARMGVMGGAFVTDFHHFAVTFNFASLPCIILAFVLGIFYGVHEICNISECTE